MAIIMKFGGTSVANAEAINQVAGIVAKNISRSPVVVTSALAGVTNLLLEIAELAVHAKSGTKIRNILREIAVMHLNVLGKFESRSRSKIEAGFRREFSELTCFVEILSASRVVGKKEMDAIASFGERFSSWLLAGALLDEGISAERVDSRELVLTDGNFGAAEVDFSATRRNFARVVGPLVRRGIVPVITGFIGRDEEGNTTTLGRGGSDYSAAIAAVCLSAEEIQIWKDIPGFMTADPRIVEDAVTIPQMSFSEAAELSYFGAKLLHPKTIHPAIEKNIPVRILNTFRPMDPGTRIVGRARRARKIPPICLTSDLPVRAISYKKNITVINVMSLRMLGPYGFLEELFRIFSHHRVPVDVVATSEVNVSMTIEDCALSAELIGALEKIGNVDVRRGHVIIALVGHGLKNDTRVEANIFDVLRAEKIPTEMISKGASAINLSFIVQEKYHKRAVRALHQRFFT